MTNRNRFVWVRQAEAKDGAKFAEWALSNTSSQFDSEVPKYPSTVTLCAYDQNGPLAYLPIQNPLMLDSLAPRPGATKKEISVALRELVQMAVSLAHKHGSGEIYFLGTDEGTNYLAENQLFERMPWPVYRLRLSDLEKSNA